MKEHNKHHYCLILCGGVGSRFWPFSRENKPKQFLDFLGTGRSLLQMTVDRIRPLVEPENIFLVTNKGYSDMIAEQLPDIPKENILLEPARRNTAPCICWATHHIAARDPKALMVVLPSDHLILKESEFVDAISEGFDFVASHRRLLTLGIKPRNPNTGYGYIQASIACTDFPDILKVKSFTEKPSQEMAELFISTGEFFWNAGIFMWKATSMLEAFEKYAPQIAHIFSPGKGLYGTSEEEAFIDREFATCPSISIDYAIMEKAPNVYVRTVDLGWSDLGTWKALHEVSPRTADGNVTQNAQTLTRDCSGCVFSIAGDKIVVAAGLENYIVADTDNALLIYPIDQEQRIRQIVTEVRDRFGENYI